MKGSRVGVGLPPHRAQRMGSLVQKAPLEEEIATHSSILTWEIPQTEELGRIQSMGLQKSQARLSD